MELNIVEGQKIFNRDTIKYIVQTVFLYLLSDPLADFGNNKNPCLSPYLIQFQVL